MLRGNEVSNSKKGREDEWHDGGRKRQILVSYQYGVPGGFYDENIDPAIDQLTPSSTSRRKGDTPY